ncbi:disease resistance protein RPM1-like [Tasmannia lanceolata]|uniref:disease resistance protein RPM1-like n=1 Tax=Tasmannia lanceolata TaxID=3420 RepID=UPI004063F966
MLFAVVGMGGLVKTTLVTQTYNHAVKKHFHCHAWICVSQSYQIEELLKRLIKELLKANMEVPPNEIHKMDYRQLVETTISYLWGKKYVVVLDDVWTMDVWSQISVAFRNDKCGSRVMLTTRQVDVASSSSFLGGIGSCVFHLEPLHDDKALTLLATCNCLMALREKTILDWKKVENSIGSDLSNNPIFERLKSILLLSFNDLPYYLKHCFLYCSIFPEDQIIKRKKTIRLWVAEGFVEERRGLTMEEVAEEYLNGLIFRTKGEIVTDVGNLTQLRKFGITMARREYGRELSASITKMKSLLVLKIVANNEEETLELKTFSLPHLYKILLLGHLDKLPHWLGTLDNLTHTMGRGCAYMMETSLSSRYILGRHDSIEFYKDRGENNESIERLDLARFGELKMLPWGIEYLTTLKGLFLWHMLEQLVARLRTDESGDRLKVSHIPKIRSSVMKEGKYVYEDLP